MSLVFNGVYSVINGGGGGPTASDAILTVTVPTGFAVTMTKGGVTLTPTMWVKAADPTLDCALFVIPASMFDSQNAWTVTTTIGTYTQSDTVTISSNKQYDLLMGSRWFIRNGVLVDSSFGIFGNVTASQGSGVYTVQTTGNTTGGLKSAQVDLSVFSTIVLDLSSGCQSWKSAGTPAVGYGSSITLSGYDVVGFTGFTFLNNATGSITQGQYTVDISGVNGLYEVACSIGGSGRMSPEKGALNIINAYLE